MRENEILLFYNALAICIQFCQASVLNGFKLILEVLFSAIYGLENEGVRHKKNRSNRQWQMKGLLDRLCDKNDPFSERLLQSLAKNFKKI